MTMCGQSGLCNVSPLAGIRIVSLAVNIPGPTAAMRLHALGAQITKIEPPTGDPANHACPDYYALIHQGQEVVTLDLKAPEDRARLDHYLDQAGLLLTSSRLAALERLGFAWDMLHARFPGLCHVAIVGHLAPWDHVPGHDIMFQAATGLVEPPHMPTTLTADLAASEMAVSAAVALLLARERGHGAGFMQVAIEDASRLFALPLRFGLTGAGPLGGEWPVYGLYRTGEGYVVLAALEPHFVETLSRELGIEKPSREALETAFRRRTALEWEDWARERGLPLAAVRDARGVIREG